MLFSLGWRGCGVCTWIIVWLSELGNTEVLPVMQQLKFKKCFSAFPFQIMMFCLLFHNILSTPCPIAIYLLSDDFFWCYRDKVKISPCS